MGVGAATMLAACTVSTATTGPNAGAASGVSQNVNGLAGTVVSTPYQLPDRSLLGPGSQRVATHEVLTGDLTLVFFGYTRCPDICQAVMADITSALSRLSEADAARVGVLFITSDPARDDAETLAAYLGRFDSSFVGLTGPLADITEVAAGVKVFIDRGAKLPSGGYEVEHGTPILGVTSAGAVPIVWTEGTSASRLAGDLQRILADPSLLEAPA